MTNQRKILEQVVGNSLSGKGSHVGTKDIFAGLGWKASGIRPAGAPHSVFELLRHMIYWQDWAVKWLDGENPAIPKHASEGWPDSPCPANAKEWQQTVRAFRSGLKELDRRTRKADLFEARGEHTRLGMIQAIAGHNSHHAGQAVTVRQILGAWPPPSGGVTW